MHVELATDLVGSNAQERLLLLGMIAHGLTGRHRVVAEARDGFDAWVNGLGDAVLREEVRLALDEGERREATGPPKDTLRVANVAGAEYVSLARASVLLGYPFRVLLEDGNTDRDFLLAFTDGATRKELVDAERLGWLLFETGGGIGGVVKRLGDVCASPVGYPATTRTFYLVDSDAMERAQPSESAKRVAELLQEVSKKHGVSQDRLGHILKRRAVENYMPLREFKSWICGCLGGQRTNRCVKRWESAKDQGENNIGDDAGKSGSERRALYAVLALQGIADDPNFIAHFDFCNGKGACKSRTADAIWNKLSPLQQSVLKDGFTKKRLRAFFEQARDLEKRSEITGVLSIILERM